jgi:putative ABC transport system ATP-binding protein
VIFLADGAFAGYLDGADPAQINDRMSALGEW